MSALEKLKQHGVFNKELASMSGRRIPKNLQRRIRDYEISMGSPTSKMNKAPQGAYHKPGSNKK